MRRRSFSSQSPRQVRRWAATGAVTVALVSPGVAGAVQASPLDLIWQPVQASAAGAVTAAVVADAAAQQPSRRTEAPARRYDIQPGPLRQVLAEFERLSGVSVRVSEQGLLTLPSPGVSGIKTHDQALADLLVGTGLAFHFTSPTQVVVELRTLRESVDVAGHAVRRLSSPKLGGPLRDLPQTANVVTETVMREQAATTLRDVLRNVPGITMQAGEGGGGLPGDNLTMRGFSAGNDIFIDGIRDVGPYSRDTFNLEQVEVVKGPAGSIAGRGTTGGAINMVTKTPRLAPGASVQFGAGNAGYQRGTADVNVPLTTLGEGVAVRLNAMWQDTGIPGRDVVNNGSWAVAPTFAAGLGSRTRAILSYEHLTQDNVPDYGLPWAANEPASGVDSSSFYGLRDYDFEDIDHDVATVRLEHDARPGLTLRNVTRYGDTVRNSAITAPRPPNRQLQRRWMANETLGNLTSVNAAVTTGALVHDLAGGVELVREATSNRNSAQTGNQPQTSLADPNPDDRPFGPMPDITGNPSEARTTTVGAYLFDTVNLGVRWQVGGGLRVDRSAVDYTQTVLSSGETIALEREDTLVTGRASVVFKPRATSSIYAAFGTSANPSADASSTGTALSESPTAANNVNLAAERTQNIEVGTKWDVFNEQLSLTAAVFRTEKTNARTRNAQQRALHPRRTAASQWRRARRQRPDHLALVGACRSERDGQRDRGLGQPRRARRQPGARAALRVQPLVHVRHASRHHGGCRRAISGQRLPQQPGRHGRSARLLARQRHGVLCGQQPPHAEGQRQ